jgi:Domain of unknown function (DUF6398)
MAKRGRHPQRRGNTAARRQRNNRAPRGPGPRQPDLLDDVARSLASGEPLDLLQLVSMLMATIDPRRTNPFDASAADAAHISLEELAVGFAAVDEPETSALLACIGQMATDDLVRGRARRALGTRRHPLPGWLASLRGTSVCRAVEMTDPLGDGDDVLLGVRLASGHEFCLLVYIDHNMGTVVKDGFTAAGNVDDLVTRLREKSVDPDIRFAELDLADARARLDEAVTAGARTFPPFETDTWPACRPLVEWATRLMPAGGTGYQRPEWPAADRKKLAAGFFASEFGAGLRNGAYRSLLDDFVWFGVDYGPGDPLRWSPVAVEILLIDWIPRKLAADVAYLTKAPRLLRAFVRYCHQVRNVRPDLTADTLSTIDLFEAEYQRIIRSPRLQGPAALLAAVGALDPEGAQDMTAWPVGEDDEYLAELMLGRLAAAVGGERALESLGDDPLPDEPFGWAGIADDIRPVVTEILEACDACCDELLDAEYRTACRRLLARVAGGDPAVFRRRASTVVSAAAIAWLIGKANNRFGLYGGLQVKDLMAHFGLRQSVSQRARAFLKAAGVTDDPYGEITVGTPELLVAARRRQIIERRDHCRGDLAAAGQAEAEAGALLGAQPD